MIELGDEVRDVITGFKGVAIGKAQYLFGANDVRVQPRNLDSNEKPQEAIWIEESRLEKIEPAKAPVFMRTPIERNSSGDSKDWMK